MPGSHDQRSEGKQKTQVRVPWCSCQESRVRCAGEHAEGQSEAGFVSGLPMPGSGFWRAAAHARG
jgi:hypothetical protein